MDTLIGRTIGQYKILEKKPVVLGINEGADTIVQIHEDVNSLRIGAREYNIKEKSIVLKSDNFGISDAEKRYEFITPWLALNEANYKKYVKYGTWEKRRELLKKILTGNLISVSKSLGYTVPEKIKVQVDELMEVKTSLKRNAMTGFLGPFTVNFNIPEFWGLGKSVSRGFGTIKCNPI